MTDPVITVDVRSEIGALRTVVMRLASPDRTSVTAVTSLLQPSVRAQFRHNMWKRYDFRRVRDQQERLAQVLRDYGVTVLFLDGGAEVNTQHYTRDIAFGIDDALFVARMGTRYRDPEHQALSPLLATLSDVVRLPKGRVEGGDVMLFDNTVLVGLSEASDAEGVAALRETLALRGSTRAVVPVPFAHRGVIHLDTKFNIVDTHLAIISRRSFLPETIRWFEQHFELIDATDDETRAIEINTFVIGGGKVIMSERSERLAALLEQRGLTPILVDYSEVTHQPGSFRCTTLPLAREP